MTHDWRYTGTVDADPKGRQPPVWEVRCDNCSYARWSFYNGGAGNRTSFPTDFPCAGRKHDDYDWDNWAGF